MSGGGGKKKGGAKQRVVAYHMSIHYGVCEGPVDKLYRIFHGEKEAWSGPIVSASDIFIENLDLMGGFAKEGGVHGHMHYMPGAADQEAPNALASRLGLAVAHCPGYRGLCSLFFCGPSTIGGGETAGFYWSANSPYLRGIWAELQCIESHPNSYGWYPAKAAIPRIADPVSEEVEEAIANPRGSKYSGDKTDPGNSLVIVEGETGNDPTKWDTYGNYAARVENIEDTFQIWTLPDGTLNEVASGGTGSGLNGKISVHLTRDGELFTRNRDTGDFEIYDMFGTLVQSVAGNIDYQFGGVTEKTQMDDIHITGAGTYMMAFEVVPFVGVAAYRLYKDGVDWVSEDDRQLTNVPATLSVGAQYAYGIKVPTWLDTFWTTLSTTLVTTEVVMVDLFTLAETVVDLSDLEPGITNIAIVSYDRENDCVVVGCPNGDLYTFSADLTTTIASRVDGAEDLLIDRDALLCKRLFVASQTIALRHQPGDGSDIGSQDVYKFTTPYLDLVQTIDTSAREYPAYDQNFTFQGNNETWNGAFYPAHFFKSAFWFLGPPPRSDMNPAHIIFEALTNLRWGMGQPQTSLDLDSFQEAADTLHAEQFGLSMMWTRQATIEKFVSEVLDHIEATLYVSPQTGLLTIKLIRDDYDPDDLEIYDEDNSTVIEFQRKSMADIINEVVVSYTDPENEKPKTVTRQDLGGIAAQGGIVSDTRDYYGVRSQTLAARLGDRDLRVGGYPLATAVVEADRKGWDLVPGGVIKLSDAEHGISQLAMRIVNVDYGKPGEARVRLELVEDVFALEIAEYVAPPPGRWVDPGENPQAMDYTKLVTTPYMALAQAGVSADLEYPEAGVGIMAATGGSDTPTYELHGTVTDAAGVSRLQYLGDGTTLAWGKLGEAIVPEAETELDLGTLEDVTQGATAVVGGFALIGDSDEEGDELVLITRVFRGVATLQRGALDTVPQHRAAGRSVIFFHIGDKIYDTTIRSVGETARYKLLSRTSRGTLPIQNAPFVPPAGFTLTDRPYMPLRPANVKVEGVGFGAVDLSNQSPAITEFEVTWARRNRLTEDSQPLAWTAGDVPPEDGQRTRVNILDAYTREVLTTYDNLTGLSQIVALEDFQGSPPITTIIVQVQAINLNYSPPLESLQAHEISVIVDPGVDPLAITGTPVLTGQVGIDYDGFVVTATGGIPPYIFTLEGDWPPGFEITPLGVDSAAINADPPTEAGVFSTPGITVRVTDAISDIDELTPFVIEIDDEDTTAPTLSNPTGGDVP